MASQFGGLSLPLTWGNYGTPRAGARPRGHPTAALTHSDYHCTRPTFSRVPGSHPAVFRLDDNITLKVTFRQPPSFVMGWVFTTMSPPDQRFFLNHEQGHYNITALICRDFFVDLMLLLTHDFHSPHAGQLRVEHVKQDSLKLIHRVHHRYDHEVHPEQIAGMYNGPRQRAWDGYVRTAFSVPRSPATTPGGWPCMVRLVDTLRAAGV